jgi:hypothetical protein
MTRFEKTQAAISSVQTGILFLTLTAAVWIGWKQDQINENLLDLNYVPEVTITYGAKQINILNGGKTSVTLWGNKLDNEPKDFEGPPRIIAPGAFYYIPAGKFEQEVVAKLGPHGQAFVPFDVYIETENHRKYTVKGLFLCKTVKGSLSVRAQTLSIMASDWSKR